MSKKTCVLLELKFLNYPLLYSGRWMVVGMHLSAVFVAGPGLTRAQFQSLYVFTLPALKCPFVR